MVTVNGTAVPLHAAALNLLFPPLCSCCRGELDSAIQPPDLCGLCLANITRSAAPLCPHCGCALPPSASQPLAAGNGRANCPVCRNAPWELDRVVCLGPYGGELRQAIVRMKHAGQQSLTVALGKALGRQLSMLPENEIPVVLGPVPMHWRRRLTRGAGSSHLLASAISRQAGVPWEPRLLRCTRRTQKQSTLTASQRKSNVRGGFALRSSAAVKGRHVGIVDDTLTTGATANEIARLLRQAGARRITLLVAARAQDAR